MSSKNALFKLAQTMSLRRLGFTRNTVLESDIDLSDGIEEFVRLHADIMIGDKSSFYHSAVIFSGKKPTFNETISVGINKHCIDGSTVHAEADAIYNLKPKRRNRTLEVVNLLVIRVNSRGKIMSSLPCIHCRKTMARDPTLKGYRIGRVYYSTESGDIDFKTLTGLLESDEMYITSFYRHSGYDVDKWKKWRNTFLGISNSDKKRSIKRILIIQFG